MHNFSLPNAYPVYLNDSEMINAEKFSFHIVPFLPYFHLHCLLSLKTFYNPTSMLLQPLFPLQEVEKTKGSVDSRN